MFIPLGARLSGSDGCLNLGSGAKNQVERLALGRPLRFIYSNTCARRSKGKVEQGANRRAQWILALIAVFNMPGPLRQGFPACHDKSSDTVCI